MSVYAVTRDSIVSNRLGRAQLKLPFAVPATKVPRSLLMEMKDKKTKDDPKKTTTTTTKVDKNGVPEKGCVVVNEDTGELKCNFQQMSTPTCPVPGPGVVMPDGCRTQNNLVVPKLIILI